MQKNNSSCKKNQSPPTKKNKKKRDCLNCNHAYLYYTLYIDKNLFRKIKILLTDQMTIYK